MARTIGKRWPGTAPKGDYQAMCDYCGVMWRRSQLKRDRGGKLTCPDEGEGRDAVALAEAEAEAAKRATPKLATNDGGHFFKNEAGDTAAVQRLTLEDIEL